MSLNFATNKEGQVTLPLVLMKQRRKVSGEVVPAERFIGVSKLLKKKSTKKLALDEEILPSPGTEETRKVSS